MSQNHSVRARFHPPPEDLRPYFTTFYYTEIDPGEQALLHDCLHPEWGGLRIFTQPGPEGWFVGGDRVKGMGTIFTGPSTRPLHFALPKIRMWGVGFLPLGWARFVKLEASCYANRLFDVAQQEECARFTPLSSLLLAGDGASEAEELARLVAFFRGLPDEDPDDQDRIVAIHRALVDPDLATVQDLVERVDVSQRTIERTCQRHFGFSPKQLLRRQRFMRSLAQFMLDPSLKWIGAIDSHYHDQAQFVRDFREFMGMSPREYAAMPHPVLEQFAIERQRVFGSAVQTLDIPGRARGSAA